MGLEYEEIITEKLNIDKNVLEQYINDNIYEIINNSSSLSNIDKQVFKNYIINYRKKYNNYIVYNRVILNHIENYNSPTDPNTTIDPIIVNRYIHNKYIRYIALLAPSVFNPDVEYV